jgi:hypothetical protein
MISDHGRGTADYARKTRRRGVYWYHPHPEKAGNPAERCNHKGLTRQEPGRNWQVTRQVAVISDQSTGSWRGVYDPEMPHAKVTKVAKEAMNAKTIIIIPPFGGVRPLTALGPA